MTSNLVQDSWSVHYTGPQPFSLGMGGKGQGGSRREEDQLEEEQGRETRKRYSINYYQYVRDLGRRVYARDLGVSMG